MKKINNFKLMTAGLAVLVLTSFSVSSMAAPMLANIPVGIFLQDNTVNPTTFSLQMTYYPADGYTYTGDINAIQPQIGFLPTLTVAPNGSVGLAQEFELVTHTP